MGKMGSQTAGLLGLKAGGKGSSNSTGPNEGLGAGTGRPGTPEGTNFNRKEQLHPKELNPGQIVGSLPIDEEAPKGDVSVPVRAATPEALQRMAEKVDTEVLPAEYREQILRYMESLRRAAPQPTGAAPSPLGPGASPPRSPRGDPEGTSTPGKPAEGK